MNEILRHCRRCIGQDIYDNSYMVSSVPEEVIRSLSPADVVEVRHGQWINTNPYGVCSLCGRLIDIRDCYNYCPNCGAKMDGGHCNE